MPLSPAVLEGLPRLPRIGLLETLVAIRQDQAEGGDIHALASDLHHRFGEIDMGMARQVMRRNEGIPRRLTPRPYIVLHDRVSAHEPALVAQPIEHPMRRMPLFARHLRIPGRLQDRFDDAGEPIQLQPSHRSPPWVARHRRVTQHLLHCPAVYPEPPPGIVMAQSLLENRQSNRRLELHALHPPPQVRIGEGPLVAQFRTAANAPPGRYRWTNIRPALTNKFLLAA